MLSARLVRLAVDWYRRSAMRVLCGINEEEEVEEDVIEEEVEIREHARAAVAAEEVIVVAGHATRRSSRASISRRVG